MPLTNLTSSVGGGGTKNYLASLITSNGSNALSGNFDSGSTASFSLAHSTISSGTPTSVATATFPFSSSSGGSAASGNLSLSVVATSLQLAGSYSGSLVSSAASTAGDMIDLRWGNIATTLTPNGTAQDNWVAIERLGN